TGAAFQSPTLTQGPAREFTGATRRGAGVIVRWETTSGEAMSATEVDSGGSTDIHEFHIGFSEAELTELRRRINATRWPEHETVDDDSQGVPLATMQELARYWATDYDWSGCEAKLNGLPNVL